MQEGYRSFFKQRKNHVVNLVDTHCHIYSDKFINDRSEVITAAKNQGVSKILMPNVDLDSFDAMMNLANEYPEMCIPMLGLHPCSVNADFQQELDHLFQDFEATQYIAIGEIGLDLYWDKTKLDYQKLVLEQQLKIAVASELPVVLHTRSAMHEVVESIKDVDESQLTGVFHCFSESYELTGEIAELGFYFGIGGVLTHKNSGLAEAVKMIPRNRILLETDAPYLAPAPFRGKRNEPAYVWHVAKTLSDILNMSLKEVSELTTENAVNLFGQRILAG